MSFWLFVQNTKNKLYYDTGHSRLDGKGGLFQVVTAESDEFRIALFCVLLHGFLVFI